MEGASQRSDLKRFDAAQGPRIIGPQRQGRGPGIDRRSVHGLDRGDGWGLLARRVSDAASTLGGSGAPVRRQWPTPRSLFLRFPRSRGKREIPALKPLRAAGDRCSDAPWRDGALPQPRPSAAISESGPASDRRAHLSSAATECHWASTQTGGGFHLDSRASVKLSTKGSRRRLAASGATTEPRRRCRSPRRSGRCRPASPPRPRPRQRRGRRRG
jgi:hypothetical protein